MGGDVPVDGGDFDKQIPESIFADDDGSADARLAQALIKFAARKAPLGDVVDALAYARVLIPVIANGERRARGKHGLPVDEEATTGVVAVEMPDGRAALPVFTDVDAMKAWNAHARPIPAEGPRAALAAVAEQWSVLVLNPGMESVVIPRPAVWALAEGQTWRPAVAAGAVEADVLDAIRDAVPLDEHLRAVDALPGRDAEIAIVLSLVAGLTQPEVERVLARVQRALAADATVTARIDSLELRLTGA